MATGSSDSRESIGIKDVLVDLLGDARVVCAAVGWFDAPPVDGMQVCHVVGRGYDMRGGRIFEVR